MQDRGAGVYRDGTTCIGLARHGRIVAATMYDSFNGSSIFASIAIRGPVTRHWLHRIFHYPFIQLGAQVILGLVALDNPKSLHLVERLGFSLVAGIPQGHPSGALGIYACARGNCRFLRRPYE